MIDQEHKDELKARAAQKLSYEMVPALIQEDSERLEHVQGIDGYILRFIFIGKPSYMITNKDRSRFRDRIWKWFISHSTINSLCDFENENIGCVVMISPRGDRSHRDVVH